MSQPPSYQPSSTPHNWVDLGIFYHYCSKASSFKTTGYFAYPALIFCAVVEVKFLAFYLLNLHRSQKLSFWTNSVVLPDIGCHKKLFDYYWFGDVKIQYGKSKFFWWWVISSQVYMVVTDSITFRFLGPNWKCMNSRSFNAGVSTQA